jgi:class 3 adenylate cyclase/tetratricopeptide (TPR) repeat protein
MSCTRLARCIAQTLGGAKRFLHEGLAVAMQAESATPPSAPPTGAVTFAFTDIEGSTTRWERDRAAMQQAVSRHDAILRAAIKQHGGHVFKTGGDAFCCTFARPQDAIAAMISGQQRLVAEDFSAVDGLRVRAAIHTGAADEREGDYFGPAVNKVARLLAIGHGGQVLTTAETAGLVEGALPAEVSLRDLGAYHLKDFAEPQRVSQLLAPGLPAEFPPLRSLGTLPSDLSIVDAAEFHSVPAFSGRDDELEVVHTALRNDGAAALVHGLGGVGKSSIAREYGWRNRDQYSVVWWLNAQTEDGIIDGLLRLGTMFGHGLGQLADRRVAAQRVINSVLGGFDKPALLVFDNLEEEGLMRTWLPRTGARALATSRDAALSSDVIAIPLQVWSLETAVAYLRRASGRADMTEAEAGAIAQALGALPLALAHAAAALCSLRMVSPQRYLEHISEHLKNAPRGAEYPRSVFATFNTAIAQAEQHAPGAAAVLCFAAAFSPDAIPDELFRQGIECYTDGLQPVLIGDAGLDLRSTIADELRLDEALGALDRLSLLAFSQSSRTYSMHRLVQLAAQDLVDDAALTWRKCAVGVAGSAFPEVDFVTWPRCQRLLPHALTVLEALPGDDDSLSAAALAHWCALYLRERGDYGKAELFATRALAIREKILGPDHPDVAQSLDGLAVVYWREGRYVEAEPLYSRALAIREKALGSDDLDVAASLSSFALVYWDQGRYAEAEPLHMRAVAIREKALGPDHPDLANSLNNLALVYEYQGRYAEAELVHTRVLAIREKALEPDHPDLANSLNNLANVCHYEGRYAEAEVLCRRALAIWEKVLGPDHPQVALSLSNLAFMYHQQGQFADAEPLNTRALAIREKALGPDHAAVAQSLNNIANVYEKQGRYAEAEPLNTRALAIREKALGPDHPLVAQSLNSRANLRRAQGRYAEAESLLARALVIREKALGPDHPDVAQSLNDFAVLYLRQARYLEAEPLYTRALAIREKALGHDHPLTRTTREALDILRSKK